ncbi:MAG: disulfide bond formation protein B [Acidiferrobacterales bacterium]|nr:disulfide bond formation protein B [Acidiferrobacterales bacterium]
MTSFRINNLGIFTVCAIFIAVAYYMQYVMYLEPCPLCMVQRVAIMLIGLMCLAAFVHNPSRLGMIRYSVALMLLATFGAVIAGRHVWLQHLPSDRVPECFPGIGFILANNPFMDAVRIIFGGTGECAQTQWTFLGLSIPGWTLVFFLTFFGLALFQLIRQVRQPSLT